jgi:hypothetical protein
MNSAIETFRLNVLRAQNLGGLHDALSAIMTSALDASDLLRAQIVLSVSALDYFVHEITVKGMLQIFDGARPATDAFKKHKISAGLLLTSSTGSRSAFESDVRERHSFLSFQHPDKIAEAIRLFYGKPLWAEIAARMLTSENEIKTNLRLIVDRRNKIAHEADADPSFPGARWPISRQDGEEALMFVTSICEAIYASIK